MKQKWKKMPLKKACDLFTDGDWIETKNQSPNGIRLIQTGNIGSGIFKNRKNKARFINEETFEDLNCTEVLPGDLLVSRLPDPVGRSCIIPDIGSKMITAVDCTIIRPKSDLLDPEYLMYYQMSKSYYSEVYKKVTGTTRSRISRKNLGKLNIPIPPLDEQKRIVSIVDEAFEAIDRAKANIERNIENAEELFESKRNRIFEENNWVEKKLGDLTYVKSGGTPRRSTKEYWEKGTIPWYASGELNDLFTQDSVRFITSKGLGESTAKLFPKGSLLIGMYDTAALKMSILDRDATFNQAVSGAKPTEGLNLQYVMHAINSKKAEILKRRRGIRQKNLNLTKIKAILIPFPKIETQNEIVKQLGDLKDYTTDLIIFYKEKIRNLSELKKTILQQAFSGQLTGPESGWAGLADVQDGVGSKAAEAVQDYEIQQN